MNITLAQAEKIISIAKEKSIEIDTKMNIAIVDAGTNLVAFGRMDVAWLDSLDISIKKAKTAPYFDMNTRIIGELSQPGAPLFNIEYKKWNYKVWYTDLKNEKWEEPVFLESPFNKLGAIYYPSLSKNGNLYFSSSVKNNNKIYVSKNNNDHYSEPKLLDFIKDGTKYIDAVVSKDESFIIFSSDLEGGYGGVDLWISFNKNGIWQNPINLGPTINSRRNDGQPGLSPDNKTLYYSYGGSKKTKKKYLSYDELSTDLLSSQNGLLDIYQVSIPINELRKISK